MEKDKDKNDRFLILTKLKISIPDIMGTELQAISRPYQKRLFRLLEDRRYGYSTRFLKLGTNDPLSRPICKER